MTDANVTRADFFRRAALKRTEEARTVDPEGYAAFEKFAASRRGDGKRKPGTLAVRFYQAVRTTR